MRNLPLHSAFEEDTPQQVRESILHILQSPADDWR
jgi:hypothetical protein